MVHYIGHSVVCLFNASTTFRKAVYYHILTASGVENRDYGRRGYAALTTR
jgi:hypothetical protein